MQLFGFRAQRDHKAPRDGGCGLRNPSELEQPIRLLIQVVVVTLGLGTATESIFRACSSTLVRLPSAESLWRPSSCLEALPRA